MTTSVTINLPVSAKFDGCFCSDKCEHNEEMRCILSTSTRPHRRQRGYIVEHDAYIRTRWCCETFGMGEEQD